jgi:hypothetical protein
MRRRIHSGGRPSVLDGLYAYWLLDEASGNRFNVLDRSQFELTNNGTTGTSTTVVNSNQARSSSFSSGGTMFLSKDRTGIGDLSPNNKAFSVSAWVTLGAATGIKVISAVLTASGNQREWQLYWANGGAGNDVAQFLLSYNGTATAVASAPTTTGGAGTTPTNTWMHILGTWNPVSNVISCYFNGALGGTSSKASNVGFQGDSYFGIGASVSSANSQSATWHGLISNVGFWNRCLTPQEVSYIYNLNRTWPFVRPM